MRSQRRLAFPWLMSLAFPWPVSLGILGCGSDVVVRAAGTGAGGHHGATTASSSTGPSSAGGSGPSTTSDSSSSGGIMDCLILVDQGDLRIDVVGDGSPQRLPLGCGEDPMPVVQIVGGGECRYSLAARACATPEGGAALELYAPGLREPGIRDEARVRYRAADGVEYEAADGQVVLDEIGHVGSTGKGSYVATVVSKADGTATLPISGDFVLCRIPDGPPCP